MKPGDDSLPPIGHRRTLATPVPPSFASIFRATWADPVDHATATPELLPVRLARAASALLHVDGAGLSLLDGTFRVPLGASDPQACSAERLQFTQGQGPCLEAAFTGRAVAATEDQLVRNWPMFAHELLTRTSFTAIMTLPLAITPTTRGAIDLYFRDSAALPTVSLVDAITVADGTVEALNLAAGTDAGYDQWLDGPVPSWLLGPSVERRRTVWVGIGLTMTQFDVTADDALALIRAFAYGSGALVDDVAAALVHGDLDITLLA